jgi:hypothetical protein
LIASSIVAFGFDRIDGRSCVLIKQRVVICRSRDTFSVIKWTIIDVNRSVDNRWACVVWSSGLWSISIDRRTWFMYQMEYYRYRSIGGSVLCDQMDYYRYRSIGGSVLCDQVDYYRYWSIGRSVSCDQTDCDRYRDIDGSVDLFCANLS